VTGSGNQFAPVIATETTGSMLHLAWVSNASGNNDIYYASSNGLPASPLAGTNLIDDTTGADQRTPVIVIGGGAGEDPKVFVCWQDYRNAISGWDTDLYIVEVRQASETNLLVGADMSNQSEPVFGVDLYGHPYLVWTDGRNATDEIYYAFSTFVEPTPLDSQVVNAGAGATIGTASPAGVDDVSVVIPAGACPFDVTMSVARIRNLESNPSWDILPYEFGPSGLQFDVPVTITIPYLVTEFSNRLPIPYWHDALTGTMSQQGITNVQDLTLTSELHALRFQTVHLTPYLLLATTDDGDGDAPSGSSGGGGGGGGGCSLSLVSGESSTVGFLIPYVLLAVVMLGLRLRDAKRYGTSDGNPNHR
jgi:hypothetical protein